MVPKWRLKWVRFSSITGLNPVLTTSMPHGNYGRSGGAPMGNITGGPMRGWNGVEPTTVQGNAYAQAYVNGVSGIRVYYVYSPSIFSDIKGGASGYYHICPGHVYHQTHEGAISMGGGADKSRPEEPNLGRDGQSIGCDRALENRKRTARTRARAVQFQRRCATRPADHVDPRAFRVQPDQVCCRNRQGVLLSRDHVIRAGPAFRSRPAPLRCRRAGRQFPVLRTRHIRAPVWNALSLRTFWKETHHGRQLMRCGGFRQKAGGCPASGPQMVASDAWSLHTWRSAS